jgi:uncharacterized protein YndB with AHSA1/START domain
MTTLNDTGTVDVTRTFDVPLERAWRAWSDAEEVKKWWGPQGFSCSHAEVDLRPGGRTLVGMRADDGSFEIYSTWTYQEVQPSTRFTYVFAFSDPDGNPISPAALGMVGVPEESHHEVTLTALGPARTQLRVVESGYTAEGARDQSQAGLEQCLDKMAGSFA